MFPLPPLFLLYKESRTFIIYQTYCRDGQYKQKGRLHGTDTRWQVRLRCAPVKEIRPFFNKNYQKVDAVDVNQFHKQNELPFLLNACAPYSDVPLYGYWVGARHMRNKVAQNMLRTHEGIQAFSEKKIRIVTSLDQIKCPNRIK